MSFLIREPKRSLNAEGVDTSTGTEYLFKKQAVKLSSFLLISGLGAGAGYMLGKSKKAAVIGGCISAGLFILTTFTLGKALFNTSGPGLLVDTGLWPEKKYTEKSDTKS